MAFFFLAVSLAAIVPVSEPGHWHAGTQSLLRRSQSCHSDSEPERPRCTRGQPQPRPWLASQRLFQASGSDHSIPRPGPLAPTARRVSDRRVGPPSDRQTAGPGRGRRQVRPLRGPR